MLKITEEPSCVFSAVDDFECEGDGDDVAAEHDAVEGSLAGQSLGPLVHFLLLSLIPFVKCFFKNKAHKGYQVGD